MKNVVERGAVDPRAAPGFPPKTDQVHEREFELDHALGPGRAEAKLRGIFDAAADAHQAIDGKRGSGRRENQKETCDAQEGVASVENEKIALVDRGEAEVDHDAAGASTESGG